MEVIVYFIVFVFTIMELLIYFHESFCAFTVLKKTKFTSTKAHKTFMEKFTYVANFMEVN